MKSSNNIVYIVYLVENIAIFILTGFLCWYFKSFWGLVPLLFINTMRSKRNNTEDEED